MVVNAAVGEVVKSDALLVRVGTAEPDGVAAEDTDGNKVTTAVGEEDTFCVASPVRVAAGV